MLGFLRRIFARSAPPPLVFGHPYRDRDTSATRDLEPGPNPFETRVRAPSRPPPLRWRSTRPAPIRLEIVPHEGDRVLEALRANAEAWEREIPQPVPGTVGS